MKNTSLEGNIFIVQILINGIEKYYLTDYDLTISKNKRDSMIFLEENNAYKVASIVETKYKDSLGKVLSDSIENIIY